MSESITNERIAGQEAKISDLTMALVVVGFASLLAGILGSVFSGALLGLREIPEPSDANLLYYDALLLGVFMLLGLFLIQFISYTPYVEQKLPQRFALRGLLFGGAFTVVLVILALPVVAGINIPFVIQACAWLCLGVLTGLLLPIWGSAWTTLDAEREDSKAIASMVAWSVVATVVLCTFTVFAPTVVAIIALWAFFMLSNVLAAYCHKNLPVHEPIKVQVSKRRLSIFSRNLIVPGVLTLVLGIVLGYCLLTLPPLTCFIYVLSASLLAALIMVVLLLVLRYVPRQSTMERWVIGICGCAMVVWIFWSEQFESIALLLMLTSLILYVIFHFNVLVALSYRHHVLTLYHYAQGFIAPLGGLALGWLCLQLLIASGAVAVSSFWTLLIVCMLLFLIAACLVPFKSNRQVESVFIKPEDTSLTEASFDDTYKTQERGRQDNAGLWQQRMSTIAEQHKLSPREIEVFALLAKGRNAEHISKTLYISTHTVKTHIYRIYRKLEINTQQELIDKVDSLRI